MNTPGAKAYRPWTPELYAHQAHAPSAKLPEDDLVFFLIDVVPKLDLSKIHAPYQDETRGAPPFDPAMMVCLLLYSYCVGVFSSRKVARACERNLAFLAIVGEERPDFRTISLFRKNHLDAFADVFVQVLCLAKAAGLVRPGHDRHRRDKVQGNASRHKAMSYGYMTQEVARLRAEINELLKQARDVDAEEDAVLGARRGDELPRGTAAAAGPPGDDRSGDEANWKPRREPRLTPNGSVARKPRAQRQRTGTKRRGRAPGPIVDTPAEKAQTNFSEPDLSIMKTANKGWDCCGNAQASVDDGCQIILACDVTAECNDKQQAEPMAQATRGQLDQAGIAPGADEAGERPLIPAALDTGYFSGPAVEALEREGFDPHIATERQRHHSATTPAAAEPASPPATAKAKMQAKLKTAEGRAVYSRRKVIVEPVFGQIKEARGFRRFLLRGLAKIRGEWRLVCLTIIY